MTAKLRKAIGIGGGALVALVVLILVFGNAGPGRHTIEWLTPRLTGDQVVIQGLDGRFPDSLRVAHLELRDGKGVWLSAEDVALDWSPLDYLWNKLKIEDATARRIDVLRRPMEESSSGSSDLHIVVDAFKVDRLNLAAAVAWRAASVTVAGSADYTSLDAMRLNLAARRLDAPGVYRVATVISKAGISGTVDIHEPANGLIGGLTGLPALEPLSVEARASGPRNAQRIVMTLAAGALRAEAHGIVDLAGRAAQLDLSARAPAMAPGPGVAWTSLTLDGHLRGAFDKPNLDAHLAIADLKAGGGSAHSVKADIQGQGGAAELTAQLAKLTWQGLPETFFGDAPITLHARTQLDAAITPVDFEVSHRLAQMRGHLTLGQAIKATATLSLPSLKPFAALAGIEAQGSAAADMTLDVEGGKTALTLDGTIDSTGAGLAGLIGRGAKFSFAGSIQNQDIIVDHASLNGVAVTLSANGGVRGGTIAVDWSANLRDLSRLARTLSGNIALHGHMKGPQENFEITVAGDGQIAGGGSAKGPLRLAARIGGLPKAPAGEIRADGRINGGALHVLADLEQRADGALSIAITKGDWKSLHARADLLLAGNADLPAGKITLRGGRLADLQPFLGMPVSGSVQGTVGLAAGKGAPLARLALTGEKLSLQGTQIEKLALTGAITDPAGHPRADLKLAATGISADGVTGEVQAQLTGPSDALDVMVSADLADSSGNPAQLRGTARANVGTQQIEIKSLEAHYRNEIAHLVAPARINLKKGVAVDALKLDAAKAEVSLSGRLMPALDATASARNVTSEFIRLFAPDFAADGVFSADARLTGTLAVPQGKVSLRGTGIRLQGSASGTAPGELAAEAALNGKSAAIEARISQGKSLSLTISGEAPLAAGGAIDLRVKGTADLALINPVLNAEGRNLRGTASLDGTIGGTLSLPQVEGTAALSDADYQDYVQGVHLADISAHLAAHNNKISVTDLKARAGKGTLTAKGDIDLWAPGMPVNLAITAANARLVSGTLMTMDTDATLTLTGQAQSRVNLSGTVKIDKGEVTLPERMPKTVAVLDVRRKGEKSSPPRRRKTLVIGLDVTVTSPGRLFVRGRGLDAEVSGRLHVAGDTSDPDVTGAFNMRRGNLSIGGQTLNFTSGRLGFNGGGPANSLDPSLNFVAESTSGSVTAKLEVTGYASAPRIKLSSTPSLPQDEVLAHLLYQEDLKQLGPLQLAQVAEALGSLTGLSGGFNPLSSVRKGLGLDRLSVGGGQGGTGATVEAGKYVANGVYVGAKQETGGRTTAEVQIDITRHLKAQATVNTGTSADVTGNAAQADQGSSIGLSYQFNY